MRTILLTLMLSILVNGFSQTEHTHTSWCGAHDVMNNQKDENPNFASNLMLLTDESLIFSLESVKAVIPVVIHIVYKDSSEIPSMEDINAQLKGLNDDFNADNWDITEVNGGFEKLIADAKIHFKLATIDPNNRKTNGITYTKTKEPYFTIWDDVKSDEIGGKTSWNTKKYLNIWICDLSSGLRGYAQFPGGFELTDGVVMDYDDFGVYKEIKDKNDSVVKIIPHRVLTHEVGHWLGLFHIWGDEYCGDDRIRDTPKQSGPHWSCTDEKIKTCGDTDLTYNFMDYLGSECMVMFTNDQKKRMWRTLAMFRKDMLKRVNRKLTE